jgi:hypothetical protein
MGPAGLAAFASPHWAFSVTLAPYRKLVPFYRPAVSALPDAAPVRSLTRHEQEKHAAAGDGRPVSPMATPRRGVAASGRHHRTLVLQPPASRNRRRQGFCPVARVARGPWSIRCSRKPTAPRSTRRATSRTSVRLRFLMGNPNCSQMARGLFWFSVVHHFPEPLLNLESPLMGPLDISLWRRWELADALDRARIY